MYHIKFPDQICCDDFELEGVEMKLNLWMSLLAIAAIASMPGKALAHAVETDYRQLINGLEFTSTYSSGEPMGGATVEVYAPDSPHKPSIIGKMDDQGKFVFQTDETVPGDWEIKIRQDGHGDIWTIPVTADGVDFENISSDLRSDVHYAASPWMAIGTLAMGSGAALATSVRRHNS